MIQIPPSSHRWPSPQVCSVWPSPQESIVTVGFPALSAVMSWFCKPLRYYWNPFHSEKQQPIVNLRHEGPKKLNDSSSAAKSIKPFITSSQLLLGNHYCTHQVSHLNLRRIPKSPSVRVLVWGCWWFIPAACYLILDSLQRCYHIKMDEATLLHQAASPSISWGCLGPAGLQIGRKVANRSPEVPILNVCV